MSDTMKDIEGMFGEEVKPTGPTVRELVKFNIWEDEPTPKDFLLSGLKREGKTYNVASHGKVPYDVLDKMGEIAKKLAGLGYTLRASGDTKDRLVNEAIDNSEKIDYYLPFKKFNASVDAKVAYPYKEAYDISAQYAFKYDTLKNGLKSFLAAYIHLLTGEYCDEPNQFMVIYTACGKEDFTNPDYKSIGSQISTLLKHAIVLNIPVFNLGTTDGAERLIKFISGDVDGN